MTEITITRPDDMHLHLRDGDYLNSVANHTARQFARAIVMPNLPTPVTNVDLARAYEERIRKAIQKDYDFEPLMTLYLTDNTKGEEIVKAKQHSVHAVKYYPAGATTNSDSGVTDMSLCYETLAVMEEQQLPLLLHGEVTQQDVDIFDREAVFIDTILQRLRERFPKLKMVLEHITTEQAVEFVKSQPENIAATITPQHCLFNRNALFEGGIRPHRYCLPILKAERHREAVLEAAVSGDERFFLGTDSAPHSIGRKETSCGCAGIYSAYNALEVYTMIFEQENALDKLQGFAAEFGARFYGLPVNKGTVTLKKVESVVPKALAFGNEYLAPFLAGETISWQMHYE